MQNVPLSIIFVACAINNFANGAVCAILNVKESQIVHGFTTKLFVTMSLLYLSVVLINLIDKFLQGIFKSKELNNQYTSLLKRVLNSKIVDIQKVSSGKIFDVVKENAGLRTMMKLSWIWVFTAAIPFSTLVVKEWIYNPITAIISLISVPLVVVMSFLSEKLFSFSKEEKEKRSILQGVTSDNFINAKTIKYLNVKKFALNRLTEKQNEAWITSINPGKIWYFRIVDIIGMLPLILNIYICRNNLEMIALIVISNWTLENMRGNVIGIAEYIIEINANEDIIKDLKGDDVDICENTTEDIILDNIFFDYGEDTYKFHIPHMEFKKGSKTLVVGESGEGKSSLANLLAGAVQPTTGIVPPLDVFYVWQETESLDDSLWNNIVFHNPYDIKEDEVLEYFEALNMTEWFAKELKDGFQTQIGERGCKLSSGQKQRINIIRAVIELRNNPNRVFIFDEITSNLDDYTKGLAINLFKKYLTPDITAIIISHNDGFDKLCDRKITVKNHKFICGDI